ncbi:superfamily I DNA/RNA helicase [Salirhabdus euzebyi]|uniref:DNA 3'-5' helicase n=1 Tax=Salirhabdus euzebyi TaxID=394506 RepID=A0A841PS32_9BACI|nr:3'-5' exonuclease [Salirhabdus euzebyi]MBB6451609.1 superfamily I DNA/RNA helicase [Salirhabdus euzebyi]
MPKAIELTRQQKKCVTFKPKGDLLIQGIPGSGKSTIILARAEYLKEILPDDSLLVITFSRALTNYVRQLSAKTGYRPLDAKTFHQWGQEMLEHTDYPHTRLIVGDKRESAIRFAKNIVNKKNENVNFPNMIENSKSDKALIRFLCDEIEWIKGIGITTREDYLSIKRSGRGTDIRVTKIHRDTIYDVLEKYNELLSGHYKHQGIDGDDLARILVDKADQIPASLRPDHILVDEAQDLHTMQLKAMSSIAKKSLTIGADKGQQIYRRSFTWKAAGIKVAGNRSQLLKQTFRSTRQIIRLANDFQQQDKIYLKDEDYYRAEEPNIDGKVPELCLCEDSENEDKVILEHVKTIRSSYPEDTIGIIAQSHYKLDKVKELLEDKGIPVYRVKDDNADIVSPGVKLITYQSSKGLEFDNVIITDLKKGKLPYRAPAPGEDEEDFMSRERKKLYVAMTRAKKTLLLIAVKEYSSFVNELNKDLYKLYRK